MLKTLDIQNVALIDNLNLSFDKGLTVLSGETGAGKSIIIDALNFVMGAKANKGLIKQGKDFMKVTACFSAPFINEVVEFLQEFDIEYEDEIVLSRKLTTDGKSDLRINGVVIPSTVFKKLSILLVDIHGQYEHQKLLKEKYHLEIVDDFIKDKSIFVKYQNLYQNLLNINKKIKNLNSSVENQDRLLDLLDYQIKEIENANLQMGEDELLEQKKLLMQNSEKIFDALNNTYQQFEGNQSIIDGLKSAINSINSIIRYDTSLSPFLEKLENIKYDTMDIANEIKERLNQCNYDEYEFEQVDERLDKIKSLKRKYGAKLEDVFAFLQKSKQEYDEIVNSRSTLQTLLKQKQQLLDVLFDNAKIISEIRREVAVEFESKVNQELYDLGMKNARFKVDFRPMPLKENTEEFLSQSGFDDVKFLFSANAGQDLKLLSEIISGGEASRFMLALKNIMADIDDISLMVFDEIDTGISGEMGYKVACKLANISKKHQVLSVSHLPVICAMADNNMFVEKDVKDNNTFVSVSTLSKEQTLMEIARISGGAIKSDTSISYAKELKQRCDDFKMQIK